MKVYEIDGEIIGILYVDGFIYCKFCYYIMFFLVGFVVGVNYNIVGGGVNYLCLFYDFSLFLFVSEI